MQENPLPGPSFHSSGIPSVPDVARDPFNWSFGAGVPDHVGDVPYPSRNEGDSSGGAPFTIPDMQYTPRAENAGATRNELLRLSLFEALPPTEMIEDLHRTYFMKQHPLIPILHPSRYMQAFYLGPHLRPPMGLTYAIWTMAANGHEKYASYHDVFHRRARHYLQEDELRGDGEHFITVAHAQAWALIATDEARCMWFTRAAMSAARCIKLLHMMGLHRLDDPNASVELAPTITPPRDWTELEERRRVFWGALCIDSHASISTGWPCLIDMNDVTTRLPSSEEAFNECREEETCRLEDVFRGSSYSSFAGAAIICHIFNQILKHVHRSKPGDCPDNFEYGPYWNKHRELDNLLSSAFMFLPERFRLPKNVRDPVAVHTNLNLHAAVICLHNSAYEMASEHKLPETVAQTSRARLLTASQEVVNVVKLTSHANAGYRSPLVALALYVASSVYITTAQDSGLEPTGTANLEFLLVAMGAIGRQHLITRSFLRQAVLDLQRAGLLGLVRVPPLAGAGNGTGTGTGTDPDTGGSSSVASCGGNIPLFARSRASRHTDIQPPLPGRLPLNNPIGTRGPEGQVGEVTHWNVDSSGHHDGEGLGPGGGGGGGNGNKRRRVALSPDPAPPRPPGNDPSLWFQSGPVDGILASGTRARGEPLPSGAPNAAQFRLPHRAGSSTGSSPAPAPAPASASASASEAATKSAPTPASMTSLGTVSAGSHHHHQQQTIGAMMSSNQGGIPTMDHLADTFGTLAGAPQVGGGGGGGGDDGDDDAVDLSMSRGLSAWDVTGDTAQDARDAAALMYAQMTETLEQAGCFAASPGNDGWMVLNEAGVADQPWDTGQAQGWGEGGGGGG